MNAFVLACMQDMVEQIGEPCPAGGKCWCGWPHIKPREKYHTAMCYEFRKYFKQLEEEGESNARHCDVSE